MNGYDHEVGCAFDLWAKTGKDSEAWHALPYHLLDVGAAADVLYDRLSDTSRRRWETASGGGKALAIFLAASHDIGKANPYFQYKAPDQRERLAALGFPIKDGEPRRHGQATVAYLDAWLADRGWPGDLGRSIAITVGGHHGRFHLDARHTSLGIDESPWRETGRELLNQIAALFPCERASFPRLNPALAWLAGFVSVADWLGSHEAMVGEGRREPQDLRAYFEAAKHRAAVLLDKLNLRATPATPPLSLEAILGGRAARPLQIAASRLADEDWSLALIEAPTGEGKTEAAFMLSEAARAKGAGGTYFALPTMATANGLLGRVTAFVGQIAGGDPVELRLLHGKAWMSDAFAALRENPQEPEPQGPVASEWFDGSKRGLIAPFGVGTVDQPLIAALRVKHGSVRLFALAGKTVVVDEVHAYDVYMGRLLDRLLEWLHALGCRVVLLSATLPPARRAELFAAWGAAPPVEGAYPSLTWAGDEGSARVVAFPARPRKPVRIVAGGSTEEEEIALVEAVEVEGGCGAILRNTVGEAQASFRRLIALTEGRGVEVILFHTRFTALDRDRIEREVLDRFGLTAAPERRDRVILVATQVVEQSLDLDFDRMVSARAPMDLLIQRAGRLHRHLRESDGRLLASGNEDGRGEAVLCVTEPVGHEASMYAQAVMVRTEALLARGPVDLVEASDTAHAVEEAYRGLDTGEAEAAYSARLAEAFAYDAAKQDTLSGAARNVRLPRPDREDPFFQVDGEAADDDENSPLFARTRYEERPTLEVAILWEVAGGIALSPGGVARSLASEAKGALRREVEEAKVRVPAYRELRDLPRPTLLGGAVPVVIGADGGFCTGAAAFQYDGVMGFRKREGNG